MGGQGSKPAHRVEVRLEPPLFLDPPDNLLFVARVHSAADGTSKYKVWGEPQLVGLWADDIITVSLHAAKSEKDFDLYEYEDIAELYLPWELVSNGIPPGEEVVVDLALSQSGPWLGQNASLAEYQEAFQRSCEQGRSGPRMRVGLRESLDGSRPDLRSQGSVPHPRELPYEVGPGNLERDQWYGEAALPRRRLSATPAGGGGGGGGTPSPPMMPATATFWSPDMSQMRPRPPQPEESSTVRGIDGGSTAARSEDLDLELAAAYRELAAMGDGAQLEEQEEEEGTQWERRYSALMAQIHAIIQENNELSSQRDSEIKALEEEVSSPQWQQLPGMQPPVDLQSNAIQQARRIDQYNDELAEADADCKRLEAFLNEAHEEAMSRKAEAELQGYLQLQTENDKLQQEITVREREILLLKDTPLPGTSGLSCASTVFDHSLANTELEAEVESLHQQYAELQQYQVQQRMEMEQRLDQLRRETQALQEQLQEVSECRGQEEIGLEELQRVHQRELKEIRSSAVERQRSTRQREALKKDADRCSRRIAILDQNIMQLQAEQEDLAERARQARQTVPEIARLQDVPEIARLQDALSEQRQQVMAIAQDEDALREEQKEAQRDLDRATLEEKLAEKLAAHKMRLALYPAGPDTH